MEFWIKFVDFQRVFIVLNFSFDFREYTESESDNELKERESITKALINKDKKQEQDNVGF
jgi:hypothetical protein